MQLEEYDQTCLQDIQQFDDGASLAGYDWTSDGFQPAGSTGHTPEQHTAAAHPAPPAAAVAVGRSELGQQQEEQQQAVAEGAADGAAGRGPPSPPPSGRLLLGSAASKALDDASLRKAAYRYRHINKLLKFGLGALGTAAQRQEWQVWWEMQEGGAGLLVLIA